MRSLTTNNDLINNDLLCILGGSSQGETVFKQLNCVKNDDNKNINNMSFSNLTRINADADSETKKLSNCDLQHIGFNDGQDLLSFYISDHSKYGNCIVVMKSKDGNDDDLESTDNGYNVYSIDNDKWLFKKNFQSDMFDSDKYFDSQYARTLLLNDSYVVPPGCRIF